MVVVHAWRLMEHFFFDFVCISTQLPKHPFHVVRIVTKTNKKSFLLYAATGLLFHMIRFFGHDSTSNF